jgi:hypothetical protein
MKKYKGVNYGYRPMSYWDDANPLAAILRNVKGENRRQMIADYWKNGSVEQLEPSILEDEQDAETVRRRGAIHPSFMGGEYLPSYLTGEVEVARICLRSTTSDVITLRARPVPEGIAYRAEDEYDGEFTLPLKVSTEPLTLEELIRQFDEGKLRDLDWDGGLSLGYNNMNAEACRFEELRHFTRITSSLYPGLNQHYESVFTDWVRESCEKRDRTRGEEAS